MAKSPIRFTWTSPIMISGCLPTLISRTSIRLRRIGDWFKPPSVHSLQEHPQAEIALSAHSGAGLDVLRGHLKTCMGYTGETHNSLYRDRRCLDALARALRKKGSMMMSTDTVGLNPGKEPSAHSEGAQVEVQPC